MKAYHGAAGAAPHLESAVHRKHPPLDRAMIQMASVSGEHATAASSSRQ